MSLQNLLSNTGKETLIATVNQITNLTSAKGNAYQKVIVTDDSCQTEITVQRGRGQLLPDDIINQRAQFNLTSSFYNNRIGISGYWNDRAQVNQGQAPTGQYNAPPFEPPVQSQPVNPPVPQLSIESKCICRQAIAKSVLESYPTLIPEDRQGMADSWVNWCITGSWQHPDVQEGSADSEIPFD